MENKYRIKKLDRGSVITEHRSTGLLTRGIESNEGTILFLLAEVEKELRKNGRSEFMFSFEVGNCIDDEKK